MKKAVISLISFIIMFITTYLILCYLPNFRIKLAAPPMVYFVESIKHMVFFKILVSVIVGLLVTGIPFIIQRRAKQAYPPIIQFIHSWLWIMSKFLYSSFNLLKSSRTRCMLFLKDKYWLLYIQLFVLILSMCIN